MYFYPDSEWSITAFLFSRSHFFSLPFFSLLQQSVFCPSPPPPLPPSPPSPVPLPVWHTTFLCVEQSELKEGGEEVPPLSRHQTTTDAAYQEEWNTVKVEGSSLEHGTEKVGRGWNTRAWECVARKKENSEKFEGTSKRAKHKRKISFLQVFSSSPKGETANIYVAPNFTLFVKESIL